MNPDPRLYQGITVDGLIRLGDCPSLGKDFDISMAFMPPRWFLFLCDVCRGDCPQTGQP